MRCADEMEGEGLAALFELRKREEKRGATLRRPRLLMGLTISVECQIDGLIVVRDFNYDSNQLSASEKHDSIFVRERWLDQKPI